ncbi:MAG: two-component regulator propeller domain-containing protein, partial [Bacteroidota bacterium]
MNIVKMMLLTTFLVSFFLSNSYDIGVDVTQIDKTIWTIYQDKKSNYWFGSKENGVYYYDGQRLKHITTKNGLVSNEIRGIQEDANGNIFFDTEKGVSKFDGHNFKTLGIIAVDVPLDNWMLK